MSSDRYLALNKQTANALQLSATTGKWFIDLALSARTTTRH